MKTFNNITGKEIWQEYQKQNPSEKAKTIKDDLHFINAFENWRSQVATSLNQRRGAELSLNKKNYLGKKTRAALVCLEIKEPKTLGILIGHLWDIHRESLS